MDHVQTADGRLRVWETCRRVTPDELYRYWTEPAKLKTWWPDEVTIDPTVGGRYRFGFSQLEQHLTGTFAEVVPGKRLAFGWNWEHEPGTPERHVVVDFEPRDKDTLLTVTHGTYGGGEAEADERQGHLEGWRHFLGRLESHIRKRA